MFLERDSTGILPTHIITSLPLYSTLCRSILSICSEAGAMQPSAAVAIVQFKKSKKSKKKEQKKSKTLTSSTTFPPIHCRVSFTSSQLGQAVLVLALQWETRGSGRPQPVPRAPEGSGRPFLLPGHLGGPAAPKTAEAHTVLANVWLCICPAGLKAFAFPTPQECCKD